MDDLKNQITLKIVYNIKMALIQKNFGKKKEEKISQSKLAEMSGISRTTISRIENGILIPDLITLVRIARALDVKLSELLEGIE